ncbi:MAG: DUF3500 domain-containing protein [Acidimicrobiales bacterium]
MSTIGRRGRRDLAERMAEAAAALLGTLDEPQRSVACWPFDDHPERTRWFYTPTEHGGLALSAMAPSQQQLTMRLLAAGLSSAGYVTAATVMGLENVLDLIENFAVTWGRERGRDPGLYYVRIFGDPTGTEPWAWRFGGHHVSVHHVIVDGEVVGSTPCFLGADPASSPLLGPHLLRPLAAAEDLGRELVRSLDDAQLRRAMLSPVAPTDLVSGNRTHYGSGEGDLPLTLSEVWREPFTGELGARVTDMQAAMNAALGLTPAHLEALRLTAESRGLAADALRADQRQILRALLDTYVARLPDELAAEETERYGSEEALGQLRFAWAGGTEPGQAHYYRVQGAELLAEYDNTPRGANHVHTVWRNARSDFGADALAAHYQHHH